MFKTISVVLRSAKSFSSLSILWNSIALTSSIFTELANTIKYGKGVLYNFVFTCHSKRFPVTSLRFTEFFHTLLFFCAKPNGSIWLLAKQIETTFWHCMAVIRGCIYLADCDSVTGPLETRQGVLYLHVNYSTQHNGTATTQAHTNT